MEMLTGDLLPSPSQLTVSSLLLPHQRLTQRLAAAFLVSASSSTLTTSSSTLLLACGQRRPPPGISASLPALTMGIVLLLSNVAEFDLNAGGPQPSPLRSLPLKHPMGGQSASNFRKGPQQGCSRRDYVATDWRD
jgi:hypothetical protein